MKHNWKVTWFLLSLFVLAQVIGLGVIYSYIDVEASTPEEVVWEQLPSIAGMQLERPDVAPQYSVLYIVGAVIVGTIFILLIVRLRTVMLWKLWFTLAVVLCLQVAFGALLSSMAALFFALLFGIWKVFKPGILVHNFTELFIYGGLATIFVPILSVLAAFVLLLLLSLYDAYAVWKSKHMIKMAKFQTKSGIFAGLLLPYKKKMRKYKVSKKARKLKYTSDVKTAVLGGGDIGFPLVFSGTVLVSQGFIPALVITFFAAGSLLYLLYSSKKDRFYPAMPFLTVGCTVGYLVGLLL